MSQFKRNPNGYWMPPGYLTGTQVTDIETGTRVLGVPVPITSQDCWHTAPATEPVDVGHMVAWFVLFLYETLDFPYNWRWSMQNLVLLRQQQQHLHSAPRVLFLLFSACASYHWSAGAAVVAAGKRVTHHQMMTTTTTRVASWWAFDSACH